MKKIIVIRHCSATGQERDAELTTDGKTSKHPCYIPFRKPTTNRPYYFKPICASYRFYSALCTQANLSIQEDERLAERILSDVSMDDWMQKLESTLQI